MEETVKIYVKTLTEMMLHNVKILALYPKFLVIISKLFI